MKLKVMDTDSPDIAVLESINEEAIPSCERNSLEDLINTGATVIGIYTDEPVGFMVIREFGTLIYLAYLAIRQDLRSNGFGGIAVRDLISAFPENMIVVEYEAIDPCLLITI